MCPPCAPCRLSSAGSACPRSARAACRSFSWCWSSYAAARYTTGLIHPASAQFGALWAAISGIVALQDTLSATGHAARLRVWGTVVGAAVSAGYLMLLPFSMTGLALAAGAAAAAAALLQQKDGGRLAAITVTVIMLLTEMNPSQHPLVSVGMRLFEASLGAALAVAVSWGLGARRAASARGGCAMTQHPERAFIRAVIAEGRRDVAAPTNPLAESLGMTIRAAADGRVTAGFVADSRFTQGNGVIQGGILATMLDFGMVFAAFSVIPADRTLATVSQTTSFLRPAAPGPLHRGGGGGTRRTPRRSRPRRDPRRRGPNRRHRHRAARRGAAAEDAMTLYVDADACPVKDEIVRVAERHDVPVVLVSKPRLPHRRPPAPALGDGGAGAGRGG